MEITIYGIIDGETPQGMQGVATLEDGTIISTHFCSSEGFAKSDLGFGNPLHTKDPFYDKPHCTVTFNENMKKKYDKLFPKGYKLVWLGKDHNIKLKIEEWLEKNK